MELTVLIGSCDKYVFLWKNFDILFRKYWQLTTKNILVSETKIFDNNNYITVTPGNIPWGSRILEALKQVDTEYVFFILDDYYLTEQFTEEFINENINILKQFNARKILIDIIYSEPIYSLIHLKENLYKFHMHSLYLNSVQPAIWETAYLKQVLSPTYSPWDFELIGNDVAKTHNPNIILNARPKHMYCNLVQSGRIMLDEQKKLFEIEHLQ